MSGTIEAGRKIREGEGRDFAQGLWTLPTIRAATRPHSPQLAVLRFCIYLQSHGGKRPFDEVLQMAANYVQKAKLILGRFPIPWPKPNWKVLPIDPGTVPLTRSGTVDASGGKE